MPPLPGLPGALLGIASAGVIIAGIGIVAVFLAGLVVPQHADRLTMPALAAIVVGFLLSLVGLVVDIFWPLITTVVFALVMVAAAVVLIMVRRRGAP